jgi:hypothetical protein
MRLSLFGSYLIGLKYFALNKFSGMECQRGKLFERNELFPEQWNEAEFIAKDLKPKFFCALFFKEKCNYINL